MTAGRGIIHSEMPQQENGRMRGFQLWINLPAKEKMKPAGYRDIQAGDIPVVELAGGGRVKVIAGTLQADGKSTAGPIQGLSTDPLYLDVQLPAGGTLSQPVAAGHNVFVYAFEGSMSIAGRDVPTNTGAALGCGRDRRSRGGAAGRALSRARRQADRRTDRAVRPLRDEHPRGDRAGGARLPERALRPRLSGATSAGVGRSLHAFAAVSICSVIRTRPVSVPALHVPVAPGCNRCATRHELRFMEARS